LILVVRNSSRRLKIIGLSCEKKCKKTGEIHGYYGRKKVFNFGKDETRANFWKKNFYAWVDKRFSNDWKIEYVIAYSAERIWKGHGLYPSIEDALKGIPTEFNMIKVSVENNVTLLVWEHMQDHSYPPDIIQPLMKNGEIVQ